MKKKILGIVLSLTMVGAMLAGCGQQQGAEDKKEETKTEDTKTDDTEKADDADKKEEPADESKTEGSGKFAPVAKEDLKVGVIHITDPAEGSGYTYTHDQGIVEMQKELGLEDSQIIRKNNIPDTDPTKTEQAIRECIEDGCQIIFATSFNYMDTCEQLAEEFPDVIFSHGTGYK